MNAHQQPQRFDAAQSLDRARTRLRLEDFYQRVRQLALAPQPDLEVIAEVIQEDMSFSELVLRVVNSTRTGLFHPVHSVRHAVTLLGGAGVFSLADAELDRLRELWRRVADTDESGAAERRVPLMRDAAQPRHYRSA